MRSCNLLSFIVDDGSQEEDVLQHEDEDDVSQPDGSQVTSVSHQEGDPQSASRTLQETLPCAQRSRSLEVGH